MCPPPLDGSHIQVILLDEDQGWAEVGHISFHQGLSSHQGLLAHRGGLPSHLTEPSGKRLPRPQGFSYWQDCID